MKKNRLPLLLKITGGTIIVLFLAVFTWANWSPLTPAEKLKPKAFALFDLSNVKDANTLTTVNTDMQLTSGVVATSVRPMDKLLSVVYYTDMISQTDLLNKLTALTNATVSFKELKATGPTCPVAGMMGSIAMVKRALCVRS